jgi:hypothetical protein
VNSATDYAGRSSRLRLLIATFYVVWVSPIAAIAQSSLNLSEPVAPTRVVADESPGSNRDGDPGGAIALVERDEFEDVIETDRNSFTFSRLTAGAGRMIIE